MSGRRLDPDLGVLFIFTSSTQHKKTDPLPRPWIAEKKRVNYVPKYTRILILFFCVGLPESIPWALHIHLPPLLQGLLHCHFLPDFQVSLSSPPLSTTAAVGRIRVLLLFCQRSFKVESSDAIPPRRCLHLLLDLISFIPHTRSITVNSFRHHVRFTTSFSYDDWCLVHRVLCVLRVGSLVLGHTESCYMLKCAYCA